MARTKAAKQEPNEPEEESLEIADSDVDEADDDGPGAGSGPITGRPMSKASAAREAIRHGIESPQEASAYIMQQFGIEMAPQHFSAVKSQLRKKERESEATGMQSGPGRRGRRAPACPSAPSATGASPGSGGCPPAPRP